MKTTIKTMALVLSTGVLLVMSHISSAAELHTIQAETQVSDIVIVPECASFPHCWPEVETSGK
ncbi:hypothetical protein [Pseudoalteromonas viridis]|uniref:Uncharacterized protein n=1 Tax=Pseudoalteromonas viridis TaxID=339617 RepID=A0ABX7V6H9_9GAMM|nr:hypothetical protein [Pseudoalteromonas viridis]QTL36479.1 hypothetical protein J5X90_05375 [Pseudoalteromonas viridis]